MIGSPRSITPTDPGSAQSGSPTTRVAAHAVRATSTVTAAQMPMARPVRICPPARITGAAVPDPLEVTESSTFTMSAPVCGRFSGAFSRQRMTICASEAGVSTRSSRMSRGFSLSCAASMRDGGKSWNGVRPASSS